LRQVHSRRSRCSSVPRLDEGAVRAAFHLLKGTFLRGRSVHETGHARTRTPLIRACAALDGARGRGLTCACVSCERADGCSMMSTVREKYKSGVPGTFLRAERSAASCVTTKYLRSFVVPVSDGSARRVSVTDSDVVICHPPAQMNWLLTDDRANPIRRGQARRRCRRDDGAILLGECERRRCPFTERAQLVQHTPAVGLRHARQTASVIGYTHARWSGGLARYR
jgi:hypothetical protein